MIQQWLHLTTQQSLSWQSIANKMENKQILDWFDHLASQMEAFMNTNHNLLLDAMPEAMQVDLAG